MTTPTRREALGLIGAGLMTSVASGAGGPQFPKGAIIRTVLKDLHPAALNGGATLFHEHLSLAPDFMPRWMALARAARAGNNKQKSTSAPAAAPQSFFMQDLDLMSGEMRAAAQEGVACIVDGGHPDMGRDFDFLKRLSAKSRMPIVAGCGFYAQPFYPSQITAMGEEEIVRELLRQTAAERVGAFGEIGSWDEITPDERKVFRAVGHAHLETNLPIFTHTAFGKDAIEQLDIFESVGVKPARVAIGHVGGLIDPKVEVHKALCKRGAFVGFDRQGGPGDTAQVPMVVALIEAGYAGNLLFSSDLSSAAQIKHNGGAGYAKTLTVFAPKLKAAGVTQETLHGILVDNPRRFLAFVPKKRLL